MIGKLLQANVSLEIFAFLLKRNSSIVDICIFLFECNEKSYTPLLSFLIICGVSKLSPGSA